MRSLNKKNQRMVVLTYIFAKVKDLIFLAALYVFHRC
jgi:hypothetical protein